MKRIMIIGSGGAGKSTLAQQLGEILGIEVVHLDAHFWRPEWQKTPKDEWIQIQQQLLVSESWIADGNYRSTLEVRLNLADTVILLEYPRILCVYRALKRIRRYYGQTRPDVREGCLEQLDWDFIKWIWNFPTQTLPEIWQKLRKNGGGKTIIVHKSPRETKAFLNQLQAERDRAKARAADPAEQEQFHDK